MNPSDDLKNAILRFYESFTAGDVNIIEPILSRESSSLSIGTDPNEWWTGYDTIARVFKAQFQEMGGVQMKAGDVKAFVEGTVGWVADRPIMRLPNGQEVMFRVTAVFHQEDGVWKMVQSHASVGVSNEEAIGKELTTR
jgi:hypothetical protein